MVELRAISTREPAGLSSPWLAPPGPDDRAGPPSPDSRRRRSPGRQTLPPWRSGGAEPRQRIDRRRTASRPSGLCASSSSRDSSCSRSRNNIMVFSIMFSRITTSRGRAGQRDALRATTRSHRTTPAKSARSRTARRVPGQEWSLESPYARRLHPICSPMNCANARCVSGSP